MTGSDPQFLVRGPFDRGVWEWEFDAERSTDAPDPAAQIYYAPNGEFSESASVRFAPLPAAAGRCRLTFWLPSPAALLRFDPADAAGRLRIGAVRARRLGRGGALLRAAARHMRTRGARSMGAWLSRVAGAAPAGAAAVRRVLLDFILDQDVPDQAALVQSIVDTRAARYSARREAGLFSLLTTVYDTPAIYLHELAGSLRQQTWDDFEWIVLDNGSSNRETLAALQDIARDPRVRLTKVDANLGIVGGMRSVLERAGCRYVLPVDSDDYLFPDALAVFASVIQRTGYPAVLFSDEDKLRDGRHVDAFHKPDWDPVLFRNCCYIAHLCAISREDALRLGVYSDRRAEGCHDWDTFLRFSRAGHAPVHVPEVVYSWRMHGGSTAANVAAKDYVIDSQRHVLEHHLAATGMTDRFTVVRSPLFPVSPDWWIRRGRAAAPAAALVVSGPESAAAGARLVSTAGRYAVERIVEVHEAPLIRALRVAASVSRIVVIADSTIVPRGDEWLWEIAGLFESFPDTRIVAGRVLDAAGIIVDGPHAGHRGDDPGAFGTALKQRSAETFSLRFAGFDGGWLQSLDVAALDQLSPETLTAALAERARQQGRIVATPFVAADAQQTD